MERMKILPGNKNIHQMVRFILSNHLFTVLTITTGPGDLDEKSEDEKNNDFSSNDSSSSGDDQDDGTTGIRPIADHATGFLLFRCTDSDCVKWYRSFDRCEDHIISGKHVYPATKLTLIDTAIETYKEHVERIVSNNNFNVSAVDSVAKSSFDMLVEGWALP